MFYLMTHSTHFYYGYMVSDECVPVCVCVRERARERERGGGGENFFFLNHNGIDFSLFFITE